MKHTHDEWKEIIKEFRKSRLSQRKWCEIHGEDRNRLQYWILRFRYLEIGTDVEFAEVVTGGDRIDTDTSK